MKVIVQNLATEYKDEGSGKTLLFLHGWQDNLHSFDKVSNLLVKDYRVVRVDLPGFGGSELPKEDWDLSRYVSFVADFIKKLNLDIYAIVGHSFGGRILIKGSASDTLKVEKIILIGSAGVANRKTFRNYFFKFLAKLGKIFTLIPPFLFWRDFLRKKIYKMIGSRDYVKAGALRKTFVRVINEDLSLSAKKISYPTLLIWGKNDTETPVYQGEKLSNLIQNARLEILPDSGHFVHQEKPIEVADLIKKFLENNLESHSKVR